MAGGNQLPVVVVAGTAKSVWPYIPVDKQAKSRLCGVCFLAFARGKGGHRDNPGASQFRST